MMRYLNSRKHIAAASVFALSTALIALPAMAKNESQHLRGQITSVSDSGFTMMTRSGDKRQIKMSSNTRLSAVAPGDLSDIEKGTFIGTANVNRNGENRSLEMVIFPASMKGTGQGNYHWDLTPAMAAKEIPGRKTDMGSQVSKSGDSSMSGGSSMTNGTVSSKLNSSDSSTVAKTAPKGTTGSQVNDSASNNSGSSMSSGSSTTNGTVRSSGSNSSTVAKTAPKGTTGSQVDDSASNNSGSSMSSGSSMTNGTVKQEQSGSDQSMTLKVDYGTGSKTIVVPADTPTVTIQKGEKSDLVKGAHVFVAGTPKGDSVNAQFVAVGVNGTVPPM